MNLLEYLFIISSFLSISTLTTGQPSNPEDSIRFTGNAPPPSLLSELGDLFLNVDEAIYKLANPSEPISNTQEHTTNHGRRNLRTNYFDQVRQNYEELQKRIQHSIENPANIFKPPEIMNLNFQNKGQKSFLDLSLPFLPMNVQLRGKEVKDGLKSKDDSTASNLPKIDNPFSDMSGSISIGGDMSNQRRTQSSPIRDEEISTSSEFKKRSNHQDFERLGQRDRASSKSRNQFSNSRNGQEVNPEVEESREDVEGRVLGDLLYSEDTFDKHFKRVLRDGKWVVDPKAFIPKEIVENVREFAKNQLKNGRDENEKRKGNQVQLTQNTRTKDNKNKSSQRHKTAEPETKSDIILAFTLEGVPLKLKVNPLHGSPLKYLNRVLMAAGVSLNIPIDSHRSLQPAGKDVLQLGSRSDGGQTHATYVDLTDENQLNSLLATLRNFRN